MGERQAAIAGPRWEAAAIIGRVSLSARLASGSRERSPGRKPSVSAREVTRGTDAKGGEGAGLQGTRAERPPPPAPAVCSVFVPRGWLHVTLGQQSSAAHRADAPDTGHRTQTRHTTSVWPQGVRDTPFLQLVSLMEVMSCPLRGSHAGGRVFLAHVIWSSWVPCGGTEARDEFRKEARCHFSINTSNGHGTLRRSRSGVVMGCGRVEQGHRVDQHWTGSLSDKRLFLLRASELSERKLASPGCDNSQRYFLALSPPKANNARPQMKVARLRRATATCSLGRETISLSITPNPGGL